MVQRWRRISGDSTQSRGWFHWQEHQTTHLKRQFEVDLWGMASGWEEGGERGIVSRRLELMDISYLSCRACSTHSNRLLQQEDLVFIWLAAWRPGTMGGKELDWRSTEVVASKLQSLTASIQGWFVFSTRPPLTKTISRKPFSHLVHFGIQEWITNCRVSENKWLCIADKKIICSISLKGFDQLVFSWGKLQQQRSSVQVKLLH